MIRITTTHTHDLIWTNTHTTSFVLLMIRLFFETMLKKTLFIRLRKGTFWYDQYTTCFQFQHIRQFALGKILHFTVWILLLAPTRIQFKIMLIKINTLLAFRCLIFNELTSKKH